MQCGQCQMLQAQIVRLLGDVSAQRSNYESALCTNDLVIAENERLKTEIFELTARLNAAHEEAEEADERAGRASERARLAGEAARRAELDARRAKEDADYAEWTRENALKDLKRADEYGDEYGRAQALRKLERGW